MKFSIQDVFAEIDAQAPTYGLSPKVARAIFAAENTKDGVVTDDLKVSGATVSPRGALGVMQVMPDTIKRLKTSGHLPGNYEFSSASLKSQVQAGLAAMAEMKSRQKNPADVLELATLYNGGTTPWRNYLNGVTESIPRETRQYWEKVQTALGFKGPNMADATDAPQSAGARPRVQSESTNIGTSTRVSSQVFDPTALSRILGLGESLINQGGDVDVALQSMQTLAQQRQAATQQQAAAIAQTATATGEQVAAETAIATGEAVRKQNLLSMFNLDPSQVNSFIQQAGRKINENIVNLENVGAEIDKRQSVGFFDNPLEWIVNQVRLPGMVGEYNALARSQNRLVQQTEEAQSLMAKQMPLISGLEADQIVRRGVAAAAATAGQAREKQAQVQLNSIGAAEREIATELEGKIRKFTIADRMAQLTKETITDSQTAADRKSAADARKSEQAALDMQLEKVNSWLRMIGSTNQYTPEMFKAIPPKERFDLYQKANTGRIGSDLSETVEILSEAGSLSRIAQTGDAGFATWVSNAVNQARKEAEEDLKIARNTARVGGKQLTAKQELEVVQSRLNRLQQLYQSESADMSKASDNNPMKINYVVISKDPKMAQNPVAMYINKYGPQGQEKVFNKIDEATLLDRFAVGIEKGSFTVDTASAAISDFYQQAIPLQRSLTKYTLSGMETPNNGYTAKFERAGIFAQIGGARPGATATVNLASKAQVAEYLTRIVAQKATNMNMIDFYGANAQGLAP